MPIDVGRAFVDARDEKTVRKECKSPAELRDRFRYFFVVMGIGLLNRAAMKSTNLKKWLGGPIAYTMCAVQDILVYETDVFSLKVDGE